MYLRFISCVLLSLSLCGCSPMSFFSASLGTLDTTSQERGIGGFVSDQEIKTRINVIFFEHSHVLHHKIDVNVYEGRVLLTGSVQTKDMQEDAIRLAWQVPSVKTVINEIQVEKRPSLAAYARDKWISTKLHTLLFLNGDVSSRNYEIVVSQGIVYLTGIAKDKQELDAVINTVRKARHVKKVVSYVRLMTLYETRRRKVFNERMRTSPLRELREERRDKIKDTPQKTSWPESYDQPNLPEKKKK